MRLPWPTNHRRDCVVVAVVEAVVAVRLLTPVEGEVTVRSQ